MCDITIYYVILCYDILYYIIVYHIPLCQIVPLYMSYCMAQQRWHASCGSGDITIRIIITSSITISIRSITNALLIKHYYC